MICACDTPYRCRVGFGYIGFELLAFYVRLCVALSRGVQVVCMCVMVLFVLCSLVDNTQTGYVFDLFVMLIEYIPHTFAHPITQHRWSGEY